MILIRGGRVVDPATGRDERADLILEGGVIREICAPGQAAETDFDQVIDAQNLVAAPGLVDVHVHFRDPGLTYKEDIHSGARAAARGGFTTVVCMANTKPIVDNEETLRYVLAEGKKTGIHVLSCAAVSRGFEGRELEFTEVCRITLPIAVMEYCSPMGIPIPHSRSAYRFSSFQSSFSNRRMSNFFFI